VAGALIVFLSLATYVAFNGIPFGGYDGNSGTSYIGERTSGSPAAAAAALRAAPGAVASAPVPGAPIGAGGPGAGGSGGGPGGGTIGPGSGGGFVPGGGSPQSGSTPPGGGTDPGGGPVPCTTCEPPASPGIVGNAVNQIDNAAGTSLSDGPVGDVAGAVDKTVTGTGNKVGGAIGQGGLGDKVTGDVNDTVNKVVDDLPGPLGK
jgi:hypothetical protein